MRFLYPLYLKRLKKKNSLKISKIQNISIELSLLLSIPASLGLILASEEIVNALFGYGSFTSEDIKLTGKALKFFGYGIPAFALIKVLSNFFFARNDTKNPFYISVFVVFLNILISLIFFKSIGFIIIPIATSISTWAGVAIYVLLLKKTKVFSIEINLIKKVFKIIISAVLMSLGLLYGLDYFSANLEYYNKFKSIYLMFIISLVTTIYLISCYLLGILKIKNYKTN